MILGHDYDFIDYRLVNDNDYANNVNYYCDDYDVSMNYDCKKCKTLASRERAKHWARSHDITVSDTTQEICKCKILLSKSVSTQTDTEETEETEIPTKTLILEVFRLLGVIIGRFVRSTLVFLVKLAIVVATVVAISEVALVIWQGPDVPREDFRVETKYGSTIGFQGPFIWRCIYGVWYSVFMDEFHAY